MNKERWVIAGVAVVAVSIWGFLLFTVFSSPDEPEMVDGPLGENGNGAAEMFEDALDENEAFPSSEDNGADSQDPSDVQGDEEIPPDEPVQDEGASGVTDEPSERSAPIRTRGIYPGDFQDIAPDGVASIDDVLERLEEDE